MLSVFIVVQIRTKIIQPGRTAKFFNRRRRRVCLSNGRWTDEERENIFLFGKYLLTLNGCSILIRNERRL